MEEKGHSEYQIGNTPYYIYVFHPESIIILADESKEYGKREIEEWEYTHRITESSDASDYFIENVIYDIKRELNINQDINGLYDFIYNNLY